MYFEEFKVGEKTITPAKEFTAEALDAFIEATGLRLPIFQDDVAAQAIGHRQRLIPGPMILSVTMGLVKPTGWFDHIVAVLEFEQLRFLKALHVGHSIQASIRVKHAKTTRNPDRGLVVLSYEASNQDGEAVLAADGKYLMQTRR